MEPKTLENYCLAAKKSIFETRDLKVSYRNALNQQSSKFSWSNIIQFRFYLTSLSSTGISMLY